MAGRLGPLGAPCSPGLQQYQGQGKAGKGPAMTLAAADRVLKKRQALEVTPAKAGDAEFRR